MKSVFTAALIAGGKSRRMGGDKAAISWKGVPLWKHQLMTLQALEPAEVLICCGDRNDFGVPGARIIADDFPGRGPVAGVAGALKAANYHRVVVLAVDLPEMTDDHLGKLLAAASDRCGIVCERDGYYEGLAAVYPKALADIASEVAQDRDHSLQHLVRRGAAAGLLRVEPVAASDAGLFRNLNTPGDV